MQYFTIIPAIDLKGGQCVRLRQGDMDQSTNFGNPLEMANYWLSQGASRLHIVDLDGAFAGSPLNKSVIREMVQLVQGRMTIQLGGGIRNLDCIEDYFSLGLDYLIIGTKAVEDPSFLEEACRLYPNKIILGLDANQGKVAINGWAEVTEIIAVDFLQSLTHCALAEVIYTDIERDGMMQGVNITETGKVAEKCHVPVIASGGVTSEDDLIALATYKIPFGGAIVGRALYDKAIDYQHATQAILDREMN